MLIAAQIAIVAIMTVAYALRATHLARDGRAVPRAKLLCALAGLAALIASMRLLSTAGKELLYWRTVERLLIGDLACALIAVGLTGAVLAPLARTPLRHLRPLCNPPVALALWIANLLAWQLPGAFEATLRHDSYALVQQVLLIALGLNMWVALLRGVLGPGPRMREAGALAYVLTGRLAGIGLACIGIWSPDVYYAYYLRGDSAYSTSPLADQGIAGAAMLGEMALVAVVLLLWIGARPTRRAHAPAHGTAAAEAADAAQPAGAGALAMDAQT